MKVLYKCRNSTATLTGPSISLLPPKRLRVEYQVELESGEIGAAAIVFAGVQWFDLYYEPAAFAKPGPRSYDQVAELGDTPKLRRIQKAVDAYFGERKTTLRHLRFDPDEGPHLDVICESFEIVGQL